MSKASLAGAMIALILTALPPPPTLAPQDEVKIPPKIGEMLRTEGQTTFERTHRLLLLFSPSDIDPAYREQMKWLEESGRDLVDRDVVVVSLFKYKGGFAGDQTIDMADVAAIRRKYKVDGDELTVILIGKDGRETLRENRTVDSRSIFTRINARSDGPGDG